MKLAASVACRAARPGQHIRHVGTSAADRVKLSIVHSRIENADLALAEARIVNGGGKIKAQHQGPSAHHKVVQLEDWDVACRGIAQELGLDAQEQADLAHAATSDQATVERDVIKEVRRERVFSTRLLAYCVARDVTAGALHCAYGRYDADLELEALDDVGPPCQHQLECDGRTFAVLPYKAPGDKNNSLDMVQHDDVWLEIPSGWRPVDSGADDFRHFILPKVIAAHWWATDWLLVKSSHRWPAWKTRLCGGAAGKRGISHFDFFEFGPWGRRCVIRAPISKKDVLSPTWPARLLIEQVPSPQFLEDWRTVLWLRARAAWAKDLGTTGI